MMATLIRMRPVSLLLFAFGTIGFIALVTRDTPTASVVAAFTAYFGLTAFVVTEAFGELSSKRTKFNRWTARLRRAAGALEHFPPRSGCQRAAAQRGS